MIDNKREALTHRLLLAAKQRCKRLTKRQVEDLKIDGSILISDLPVLQVAHRMAMPELVKFLRHCPLCSTFGLSEEELLQKYKKAQMLDIISKAILEKLQ